jgi:capsular exopolysaccharide synthesis family protein
MEEKIDIRAIVKKLMRQWYYFAAGTAVTVAIAMFYLFTTPNIYEVRSSILLEEDGQNGMSSQKFLKGMELMTSATRVEDEIAILKSSTLLNKAIQKVDFGVSYYVKDAFTTTEVYGHGFPFSIELDSTVNQLVNIPIHVIRISSDGYKISVHGKNIGTYNFYTKQRTGTVNEVDIDSIAAVGSRVKLEHLSFRLIADPESWKARDDRSFYFVINDLFGMAQAYRDRLNVKPESRESNMLELRLRGPIPEKEIMFLNSLMDSYLQNELEKRNELGIRTIQFIDDQLNGVSNELRQAEGSLETFRSRNNILSIDATAETLSKNLDRLQNDKLTLERKLKYYSYIANSLDNNVNVKTIQTPSTFGLEDPLLNNLLLELARLNQERIGLNYSSQAGNPVIEVLDLKIANNKKILIENVRNFIEASANALADLNQQMRTIQQAVNKLPGSERELVGIQRKFEFNDNVYNYLLEKRAEAGIAIASNTLDKQIVDRALPVGNGPVSPRRQWVIIMAVIAGISIAGLAIVAKDVMSDLINSSEDLERVTKMRSIGTIAHASRKEAALVLTAHDRSLLGESFRSLRVNLQYLTFGKAKKVIGVTSSIEGEGKTFCSVNLAQSMTNGTNKTLLIDADLRSPKVATYLNLSSEKGLSGWLIGHDSLAEIIQKTPAGFDVITSGPIPINPIDLLAHNRMGELMTIAKEKYDTIIIDTPPIGPVSEYIVLRKYVDTTICVVRAGYTSRADLKKINKLHEENQLDNLNVLLNDVRTEHMGYPYYH